MVRDSHADTLEAFYDRVMQRVCEAYREEDEEQDAEAIEMLEQKWREKLLQYIGHPRSDSVLMAGTAAATQAPSSTDEDEDFAVSSGGSSPDVAGPTIGQPSATLSDAPPAPSSVFSRMFGGKRKLHQLDGAISDDGEETESKSTGSPMSDTLLAMIDDLHDNGAEDQHSQTHSESGSANPTVPTETASDSGLNSDEEEKGDDAEQEADESTAALVSEEDLVPVSGLAGSDFPLQLAAEYSKFKHRGKRLGYFGVLRGIVLTWPSRLSSSDTVQPGELVWCYDDAVSGLNGGAGLVEVLSVDEILHEVRVKLPDGTEAITFTTQVRRLREFLIREGTVRLQSEQR